ncbi:alpha/beta fold hydrolase [Streptomyces sp. ICBB 8177]|uniref:alpha/beta fold hydrolase n=1 Tax=Streptomyces sp. ICBB 8177 TaxID=563922 RepID=UPI000D672588|nr:alpha/beta fold hydrolase [Streptomyces sp. ICBB 8177]PWI45806.1 alpha/beta hydrolase [Streptomyces sp. ICBB 8177]
MDLRMIDAGGIRLACRVSGDPGGPPVVLLHALGEDGSDWTAVAEELGRRHRVFTPDLRGHGRSDRPGQYAFELMRDDLGALLDALRLERPTLVGHSMGGVVAYLYAAKHPDRVDRLVLEDTPPPFPLDAAAPQHPGGEPDFDWDAVTATYAQLARPPADWLTGLEAITAPTLFVAGGSHSPLPQDQIAEMARRVADSRLVTIPCGHRVHACRPQDFTATLSGFLPGGTPHHYR